MKRQMNFTGSHVDFADFKAPAAKKQSQCTCILSFCAVVFALVFSASAFAEQPLKVFILAGQSNMVGQGELTAGAAGTLEIAVEDDADSTFSHLVDGAGDWIVRDDVWIWYNDSGDELTVGFGGSENTIGPECEFGHFMGDIYDEQVLIIKTAWGGKSLGKDFRPPSSGYSVDPPVADGDEGYYYQLMVSIIHDVLDNLSARFPAYNGQGYEIAGFGWHQGWNDRVSSVYSAEYEVNLVNFIHDIRDELGTPTLPFVLATTGMGDTSTKTDVELAQLAVNDVVAYPEFEGNVFAIDTRESWNGIAFWRDVAESPTDQIHHWNRNAETYFWIGRALAWEMAALTGDAPADTTAPTPDPMTFAVAPHATGETTIAMSASPATDDNYNVEYNFTCTAGGGHDSGWHYSTSYTDTGIFPGTECTYTVTARDRSANRNATAASAPASATTDEDVTAPTPNPMTWDKAPTAGGDDTLLLALETFDGDGSSGFDGVEIAVGDGTWAAKDEFVMTDGSINSNAGGTLLPFTPALNEIYTLSMDMNHVGIKYLALGFTKDPISYTVIGKSNRFPNKNGLAWIMYGHEDVTGEGPTVKIYGGLGQTNEIANTGVYVGGAFVNLAIRIDTTGDGSSFTADFFMDGVSITGGPQTIALDVDDINYAAIGSYGAYGSDSPAGSEVDNFQLTQGDPGPGLDSDTTVSMQATMATDASGVEYYFDCIAGGGHDSDWQDDNVYIDTNLSPGSAYTYRVQARDKSPVQHVTGWSTDISVTTTGQPLEVNVGDDMITWSGQEVALSPVYGGGYTPTSWAWSADPDTGVVFSATDVESPTVTITKTTANPSAVSLTLVTDDGTGPVQDTMTIDVYDTACKAAIGKGLAAENPTDFDGDCTTDLNDFAEMASAWLDDIGLSGPIAKP